MEKAIEIKRRAQRCIQSGDLDGALAEYQKLVGFEDSDPYNFVLLADLLFKKGEQQGAADHYLSAVTAYEKASLYKNAIAVCKKMTRLSLSPAKVLNALANLHALDGLAGEAALYYVQYAEHMVRSSAPAEAARALRKAFDVCQDNIKVLEQLAEAWVLSGDQHQAALALVEAVSYYQSRGQEMDAQRCTKRAATLDPTVSPGDVPIVPHAVAPAPAANGSADVAEVEADPELQVAAGALDLEPTTRESAATGSAQRAGSDVEGFDSGRHYSSPAAADHQPVTDAASASGASPSDFAASEAELAAYATSEPGANGDAYADNGDADGPQFTIDEGALAGTAVSTAADDEPDREAVYEIEIDDNEPPALAAQSAQAEAEEDVVVIDDEPEPAAAVPETASAPGLSFGTPAAAPAAAVARVPAENGPTTHEIGLQQVEALLTQAQEQFRAGDREQASATLARAAQAYEVLGRFDSAATIFRSLGRSANVSHAVLELWLVNCERRGDTREAATVACEMGDRALNAGDESEARRWFERAVGFDSANETAKRRLQRLSNGSPGGASVAVATAPQPAPAEGGRVEVAVGRGEAVTFDLSGLLSEFQRGVEAQLAGDAQSHYDLGMTYREMGLLEQAVDSFRVAVSEPRLAARALEMIGRCHADQVRWAEAVGEFRRALQHPTPDGGDAELRFHLAHALVELGESAEALAEYEKVATQLPGYEDVDERIAALRRVLGRA